MVQVMDMVDLEMDVATVQATMRIEAIHGVEATAETGAMEVTELVVETVVMVETVGNGIEEISVAKKDHQVRTAQNMRTVTKSPISIKNPTVRS